MKNEKLTYFNTMCDRIRASTPYDFLTRDENDADHQDIHVHDKRTLRLRDVWREITPPDGTRPPRRVPGPTVPGPPQGSFQSIPHDSTNDNSINESNNTTIQSNGN